MVSSPSRCQPCTICACFYRSAATHGRTHDSVTSADVFAVLNQVWLRDPSSWSVVPPPYLCKNLERTSVRHSNVPLQYVGVHDCCCNPFVMQSIMTSDMMDGVDRPSRQSSSSSSSADTTGNGTFSGTATSFTSPWTSKPRSPCTST
jgi:hypothetical protein